MQPRTMHRVLVPLARRSLWPACAAPLPRVPSRPRAAASPPPPPTRLPRRRRRHRRGRRHQEAARGEIPRRARSRTSTKSPYFGLYEVHVRRPDRLHRRQGQATCSSARCTTPKSKTNLTEERLRKLNRVDVGDLPLDLAIKKVKGNGERKLVVFSDADCPFCARLEQDAEGRRQRHDLHVPLSDRPAASGRGAQVAHHLVRRRQASKAWDDFFATGALPDNTGDCENPVAATRRARRRSYKVNATPTLVFADGSVVPGALPAQRLEAELQRAEAEAKKAAARRPRSRSRATRRTPRHRKRPPRAHDGDHRFPQEAVHRHHRVDRRLARHAVVPLPRRGQGDQERRAAHRARVAGRAVRLPRRSSATASARASTR